MYLHDCYFHHKVQHCHHYQMYILAIHHIQLFALHKIHLYTEFYLPQSLRQTVPQSVLQQLAYHG